MASLQVATNYPLMDIILSNFDSVQLHAIKTTSKLFFRIYKDRELVAKVKIEEIVSQYRLDWEDTKKIMRFINSQQCYSNFISQFGYSFVNPSTGDYICNSKIWRESGSTN